MTEFDSSNLEIDLTKLLSQITEVTYRETIERLKLAAVNESIEQARAEVTKALTARNAVSETVKNIHNEKAELEKEVSRLKRLAEAKEKRDNLLEEYNEQSKVLDELTASAKWREFAFDHQITGAKRLAIAKRGILGDKRGLGKTLTSLIWLDMNQAKRILVLAPNDVVPQFEDEIRTWQPHRTIFSLRGLPQGQRALIYPMLKLVPEFIITLNYEAWRKDKTIVDDLVAAGIDTIICDEAHRIKSSSKITARGVFQIAYKSNYCPNHGVQNYLGPWEHKAGSLKDVVLGTCPECGTALTSTVKNVLSMTGTPILNKPQELFSMLYLVDRHRFSSERNFLRNYCYSPIPGRWRFLSGGLARLTNSMSEFFVQRNRDEAGIHIPPPAVHTYYLDKDKVKYARQYKAEDDLRNAAALVLENGEAHSMLYVLEIILRERQVMSWPAGVILRDPDTKEIIGKFDVEESQKLDEAVALLEELMEEEERVIVFSKFKAPLYEMYSRFSNNNKPVMATGDQSSYAKEQIREDFDLKTAGENPRWNICFATYNAFGTGINLNAARHVVLLDDEWSPGMEDQAIGRIDRLNSVDQANVHIFRVKNSIDEFMEKLLIEKRNLTEGFESELTASDLLRHLRDEM